MKTFLALNENNAIQISEITKISRDANGMRVEFYLRDGGHAVKEDLKAPVTLAHVFKMIELMTEDDYSNKVFADWDELSEWTTSVVDREAKRKLAAEQKTFNTEGEGYTLVEE